jgi:hypothetical protein
MLAFFVPSFSSPHLPSSINTSLKGLLLLIRTVDTLHLPKINFVCCGGQSSALGWVITSQAGASSLALSKKRARQSSFFCACCLPYSVCPSGLHRSLVKKSQCILRLLNVEILDCQIELDFLWWRCSSSVPKKPAPLGGFFVPKISRVIR